MGFSRLGENNVGRSIMYSFMRVVFFICTWLSLSIAIKNDETQRTKSNAKHLESPNKVVHYISEENFRRLEDHRSTKVGLEKFGGLIDTMYFILHTSNNSEGKGLRFDNNTLAEELAAAGFSPENETKVLVHGYASNSEKFGTRFVEEYFGSTDLRDVNVVSVDWRYLSSVVDYFAAAEHAVTAGKRAGQILEDLLISQLGQQPRRIHAIGHSLGAHFVGHLGREVASLSGGMKIGRITGLDPAKPWFDMTKESNRLNKTDAEFVDIVHTNSGEIYDGCLSFPDKMGNVDFYPNGGHHQAGCIPPCNELTCPFADIIDLIELGCSHKRSYKYYTDSIRDAPDTSNFQSYQCQSYQDFEIGSCAALSDNRLCSEMLTCGHMGERLDVGKFKSKHRTASTTDGFFLRTNKKEPWSQ